MPDHISKNYDAVFDSFAEAIYFSIADKIDLKSDKTFESLKELIDDYKSGYITRHMNSSIGEIKNITKEIDPERILENIEAALLRWEEGRSIQEANNEVVRGDGAIASSIFFAAGYSIVWRTTGNACPFCATLNGKTIGRGQKFVNDNTLLEADGNPSMLISSSRLHPPLHRGCTCYIEQV